MVLRNVPFRLPKRAVLHAETGRFRARNGSFRKAKRHPLFFDTHRGLLRAASRALAKIMQASWNGACSVFPECAYAYAKIAIKSHNARLLAEFFHHRWRGYALNRDCDKWDCADCMGCIKMCFGGCKPLSPPLSQRAREWFVLCPSAFAQPFLPFYHFTFLLLWAEREWFVLWRA